MKEVAVMRLFEILTLVTLLPALLSYFVPRPKRPRWIAYLPGLAVASVLLHVVFEGYRWQMVPAYGMTALLFLRTVRIILPGTPVRRDPSSRWRRVLSIIGTVVGLLMLTITAGLLALFPVFRMPKPTGPYAVGTRYYYWIDENRPDTISPDPGDYRWVSLQVRYPAALSGNQNPMKYMDAEAVRAFATYVMKNPMPYFLWEHLTLVRTHSYLNAPVAQSETPYPLVLFSPSGLMSASAALSEELASHGYVVLTIGHPYWEPFYFDAEGGVIPFDGEVEYYKEIMRELDDPNRASLQDSTLRAIDEEARLALHRQINQRFPISTNDLRVRSEDIGFVIDELQKINAGDGSLAGKLDLARIGVMGFSKGGATAVQFCVTDPRCRAVINMDGFMYADVVDHDLAQPFMLMSSDWEGQPTEKTITSLFYDRAEDSAYRVYIGGTTHPNLGDVSLFAGLLKASGDLGPIDGERCVEIQDDYILGFFDKHLKDKAVPFLDGPSPDYPEVEFRSRHP
jgi:predicted dienelactone hydrolase